MGDTSLSLAKLLEAAFWGNSVRQWLLALTVACICYALLWLLRRVVPANLRSLLQKTHLGRFNIAAEIVEATGRTVFLAVALYAASLMLNLPERLAEVLAKILIIVLLIQAGIWGAKLSTSWLKYYRTLQGKTDDPASLTAFSLIAFLGRLAVWSVIILLILDNAGVDVTALVAGLGVGGIAVALAVQNILGDLIASLSIVLDQPFKVGDFIIVGDMMGTVERVGVKTTRVRSLSGEGLIFPNADLLASRIRNYKSMQERRVTFTIGVTYQTPHGKLQRIPAILRQIVATQEQVRFDRAHFKEFGNSALLFEVVYYVLSADFNVYRDIHQLVNLAIYEAFELEGIEFAYPTQTLHLNTATAGGTAI